MEELIENLECFKLIKKFPSKEKWSITTRRLGETFEIRLLKPINFYKINKLLTEYVGELHKYLNECIKEDKPFDKEEFLYILNPYEDTPEVDKNTLVRIDEIMKLFNLPS